MNTYDDVAKTVIEALKILKKEDINPTADAVLKCITEVYINMVYIEQELAKWREERGEGGYYVI